LKEVQWTAKIEAGNAAAHDGDAVADATLFGSVDLNRGHGTVAISNGSLGQNSVYNCNTILMATEKSGGTGRKAQYITTI
jgi:hypothetical protein